jgi:coenzyme PQQ precursor peptide PqqA
MMKWIRPVGIRASIEFPINLTRRVAMKWETPVAVDMRFGMEITMYVSNR